MRGRIAYRVYTEQSSNKQIANYTHQLCVYTKDSFGKEANKKKKKSLAFEETKVYKKMYNYDLHFDSA